MEAVDVLVGYGKPRHTRDAVSFSMDKRARYRAQAELGEAQYKLIEKWLDCYVVISRDGVMLTAAFRTRRFRCD